MNKTALATVSQMPMPFYVHDALKYDRHPQDRTLAFHQFYGQPIMKDRPDATFSHMSDERVAFRAAFNLNEAIEIIEKGLGVKISVNIEDDFHEGEAVFMDAQSQEFCKALAQSIGHANKRNLLEVIDGLSDLNVVVNGFAIELGIDMRLADQETAASNFTKADQNGNPIIGDGTNGPVGKVLKGVNFMEPQFAAMLGMGDE